MSTETLSTPLLRATADAPVCHALHVKAVPYDVWCRARHHANLSRITFRDYVIRLLAESRPYPPSATPGAAPAHVVAPN